MEERLLKLFKLADKLNENQNKIYAEIKYSANNNKLLEITVRSKIDFSHLEKCEISLKDGSMTKFDNFITLFEILIVGTSKD